MLRFGLLPQIQTEIDHAVNVLETYVANYVREEIQQEALVRKLASFARFLPVAALVNGQVVNVAGIARDAPVARPTVQGSFATLEDTLTGCWLLAWRKRAMVKGVASPKFPLFDPGVARALSARARASPIAWTAFPGAGRSPVRGARGCRATARCTPAPRGPTWFPP